MIRIFLITLALSAFAAPLQVVDTFTPHDLTTIKNELASRRTSFASKDLNNYGNHYTMTAYRTATGSSEIHEHEADIFFIHEGDAILLSGGRMVGAHLQKPGELRGTSIEGGEKRPLKTGDIVHIPAGVPHQILVTPGKPITYFVVKVKDQ